MKTIQQIMQETGAEANVKNFRYMQEHYTYKQKVRHAENVARSYEEKCREMGLNCHVSVGGLDSITLHYFLESCGVHVPCVSCSTLEQKGVQAIHKRIADEMSAVYSDREWLGAHMALLQSEIDRITDPDTRAKEQALHDACPPNMEKSFEIVTEPSAPPLHSVPAAQCAALAFILSNARTDLTAYEMKTLKNGSSGCAMPAKTKTETGMVGGVS